MSAVLPASAMRRVTCRELRLLGAAYRLPLAYAAARCARETKLYLHWTAGHYGQFFADYHVQIDADGAIYVIGDGALDALRAATYLRNSGSVSIASPSICAAATCFEERHSTIGSAGTDATCGARNAADARDSGSEG